MAQKLLYGAQIPARGQKMRCKAVAQRVGRGCGRQAPVAGAPAASSFAPDVPPAPHRARRETAEGPGLRGGGKGRDRPRPRRVRQAGREPAVPCCLCRECAELRQAGASAQVRPSASEMRRPQPYRSVTTARSRAPTQSWRDCSGAVSRTACAASGDSGRGSFLANFGLRVDRTAVASNPSCSLSQL